MGGTTKKDEAPEADFSSCTVAFATLDLYQEARSDENFRGTVIVPYIAEKTTTKAFATGIELRLNKYGVGHVEEYLQNLRGKKRKRRTDDDYATTSSDDEDDPLSCSVQVLPPENEEDLVPHFCAHCSDNMNPDPEAYKRSRKRRDKERKSPILITSVTEFSYDTDHQHIAPHDTTTLPVQHPPPPMSGRTTHTVAISNAKKMKSFPSRVACVFTVQLRDSPVELGVSAVRWVGKAADHMADFVKWHRARDDIPPTAFFVCKSPGGAKRRHKVRSFFETMKEIVSAFPEKNFTPSTAFFVEGTGAAVFPCEKVVSFMKVSKRAEERGPTLMLAAMDRPPEEAAREHEPVALLDDRPTEASSHHGKISGSKHPSEAGRGARVLGVAVEEDEGQVCAATKVCGNLGIDQLEPSARDDPYGDEGRFAKPQKANLPEWQQHALAAADAATDLMDQDNLVPEHGDGYSSYSDDEEFDEEGEEEQETLDALQATQVMATNSHQYSPSGQVMNGTTISRGRYASQETAEMDEEEEEFEEEDVEYEEEEEQSSVGSFGIGGGGVGGHHFYPAFREDGEDF